MTLPKDPSLPDDNPQNITQPSLGDSINKLEGLITDTQDEVIQDNDSKIPVLDELVDPENRNVSEPPVNNLTSDQMSELVNTIDKKLSGELNTLLDILKDAIKDSIINEIKTQLKATEEHPSHPDKDR